MDKKNKPEVLAPAGGVSGIYAAVRCGADGVYAGGKVFSARANAVNFSDEELKWAVDYCHLHGVKFYRALNVVFFDSEAEDFAREIGYSARIGVDGIIVQDLGGVYLAREIAPELPLHCSTQMTVHTPLGTEAAQKIGFCRVVPARELSLDKIRDICRTGTETEVFVHGAQCMCLSGQCYMSAVIGSRSANRGRCAQACRLPFKAGKGRAGEEYALSLKDMSLISHIDELRAAGCASFKIEGRMKRPEYTAAAVTALRHSIDGDGDISEDLERLEAVFSRSGFSDGYLTGHIGKEMFGYRRKEDVTAAEKVLPGLAELYRDERKSGVIDFVFTAHKDAPSRLLFDCGGISGEICGKAPETARVRELSAEDVSKQLSKLGGTRYEMGKVICDIDEGISLPLSEINHMRRSAAELADKMTISSHTPSYSVYEHKPLTREMQNAAAEPAFRIRALSFEKIKDIDLSFAELIILPLSECERGEFADSSKIAAELPDIVTDEEKMLARLRRLREKGISHFICGNFTHLGALSKLEDIHIHGGTGLNITNSYAVMMCREMGLCDIVLSFEMRAAAFSHIIKAIPAGFYAYGRLPLMTVRNCPIRSSAGCGGCPGGLTDRTGRFFPVECCEKEYARILNADILETSDRLSDFGGASFSLLDLAGLSGVQAQSVIQRYIFREVPSGKYTRGLYYRGIE